MANKKSFIEKEVIIRQWSGGKQSVQVTKPYERDSNSKGVRDLVLYKDWWSDKDMSQKAYTEDEISYKNRRSFSIKSIDDWNKIIEAVENDLAPILGWDIKKKLNSGTKKEIEEAINKLIEKSPDTALKVLNQLAEKIEKGSLEEFDVLFLNQAYKSVFEVLDKVDERIINTMLEIIPKLGKQEIESLEVFNKLLDEWSLMDINNTVRHILGRLSALKVFNKLITDNETLEFSKKKESIHRFLEEQPWILDEKYEILTSNKTLKTLIQNHLKEKDKKFEMLRPDFALAHYEDDLLVIAEIKRPNFFLTLDDVDQLMVYRSLAEEYLGKKFKNFKGFLIGNRMTPELERNAGEYKNISIKLYSSIINNAETRYKEILKIMGKKKDSYLQSKEDKLMIIEKEKVG